MKFTLGWLREHLDTKLSLEEIIQALAVLGFEVERCESIGEGFLVACVKECSRHPNADRLSLCNVFDGTKEVQVVCGAPNVRLGIKVVLAQVGAVLPLMGVKIKKSKIRGCESLGMLCSSSELGLSRGESEGILELPNSYEVGDIFTVDPLIEIAVTPNRGDVLSVFGIARELAAGGYGVLTKPQSNILVDIKTYASRNTGNHTTNDKEWGSNRTIFSNADSTNANDKRFREIAFTLSEGDVCRKFSGILIEDVKNCISPDWLRNRLERMGLKTTSALVDITNYIMFSYGLPLHAYDADTIAGSILHVSLSDEKSGFLALDEKEYQLPAGSIVIRDQDLNLHAVAGVIGGKLSACTLSTSSIFLEAAVFDPVRIALAKRAMKINTESAYRFERGVDPELTEKVLKLACQMILEICGGKAGEISTIAKESEKRSIKFSVSSFTRLTGIEIDSSRMVQILTVLGFTVYLPAKSEKLLVEAESLGGICNEQNRVSIGKEGCETLGKNYAQNTSNYRAENFPIMMQGGEIDSLIVTPPSWRNDITTQACLVEEILRVYGYNKLQSINLPNKNIVIHKVSNEDRVRQYFLTAGFVEVLTWSFMSQKKCLGNSDLLCIKNPLGLEFNVMRPSIIPNLVDVAKKNLNNGIQIIRIFEIGKVYFRNSEEKVVTGLLYGDSFPRNVHEKAHRMDFFDAKAHLEALFHLFNLAGRYSFRKGDVPSLYHSGKAAIISVNNENIGFIGELHPKIVSGQKIIGFELYLEKLVYRPQRNESHFGKFPIVERDFSFVFDLDKVPFWGDIERGLYSVSSFIKSVTLFDRYEVEIKGVRMLSLAFLVIIENHEKGLLSEEIERISNEVICLMKDKFSGTLRLSCS